MNSKLPFQIRLVIYLVPIIAVLILSGCAHFSPNHPYDYSILENKQQWAITELPTLEKDYYTTTDENTRFTKRSQIVFTLMDLIDMYQYKFNSEFYGRSAGFTSAGEITAGGLTAAAAVVTPLATSQLLATLGTATIASTAIINKNFIQNKATDLLVDRMESQRKEIRVRIIGNMKSKTDEYPLGQALLDVQEYARAGTVFAAIRAINIDNAKAQKQADDKMQEVELKAKIKN